MSHKFQIVLLSVLIVLAGFTSMAFAHSGESTVAQAGMGMDTATPEAQATPTPTWVMGPYGYDNSGASMMGGDMMGGGMMSSGYGAATTLDANTAYMGGCPMMTGMSAGNGMTGTNLNAVPAADTYTYTQMMYWQNPWNLLGWVLLGVVVCGVLAGLVLGILWLARRLRTGTGS